MKKHTDTQSQQTEPECRDAPCHYSNDKPVEKDYWNGFGEWSLSAPLADIKHGR